MFDFAKIPDEKLFSQLAIDLLEAEGFQVQQRTADVNPEVVILAEETLLSHSGLSQTWQWLVQCSHHKNVEQLLPDEINQFLSIYHESDEARLLIITNADVSDEGMATLEAYINSSRTPSRQQNTGNENRDSNRKYLTYLRQILEARFSEGELRTLCFDLDIDYDGLPGQGKFDKARELVSYLDRFDRINELVDIGEQLRPGISWENISGAETKASQEAFTKKPVIKIWDRRQLENRLIRHPVIAQKYRISAKAFVQTDPSPFAGIDFGDKKILIISDTSPFAYQLFTGLNKVNPHVHMLTVWQYEGQLREEYILQNVLSIPHDLVIFFLGDSFGFPIPKPLLDKLIDTVSAGKAVILFPFFAWALRQGLYQTLKNIVPVKLIESPQAGQLWLKASRILSDGDVSSLNSEPFIENQSVTITVRSDHPILRGINEDFSVIHSFEFLALRQQAQTILSDTLGTPFLVINEAFDGPIVYINSCTHNCLTRTPILSPFEVSEQFRQIIVNTVLWCLGL